jgi:hypothetical protein
MDKQLESLRLNYHRALVALAEYALQSDGHLYEAPPAPAVRSALPYRSAHSHRVDYCAALGFDVAVGLTERLAFAEDSWKRAGRPGKPLRRFEKKLGFVLPADLHVKLAARERQQRNALHR